MVEKCLLVFCNHFFSFHLLFFLYSFWYFGIFSLLNINFLLARKGWVSMACWLTSWPVTLSQEGLNSRHTITFAFKLVFWNQGCRQRGLLLFLSHCLSLSLSLTLSLSLSFSFILSIYLSHSLYYLSLTPHSSSLSLSLSLSLPVCFTSRILETIQWCAHCLFYGTSTIVAYLIPNPFLCI